MTAWTPETWRDVIRARAPRRVIDVGANTGGFVATWLSMGAERVLAFEPVPDCFAQLAARYGGDGGDPRVALFHQGLSDVPGTVDNLNVNHCWTLLPEDDRKVQGGYQVDRNLDYADKPAFSVAFDTLDAVCTRERFAPDFIKIDTDGYDARVMRGARATLAQYRPLVMLELSAMPQFFGDCCECMIREIFTLGYRIQSVLTGEIFAGLRDFMRQYPWDTSWDALLLPSSTP